MTTTTTLTQTRSFACTDIGRRRKINQDAFLVDDKLGLYIVADGMGGHAAGEVASREAVEAVFNMVKRGLDRLPELRGPALDERVRAASRLLEGAVQAATYMIFAIAELDRQKLGMGTTISALLSLGSYAITAQVGDSRIYRIREGVSKQLTEDHTLVAWQVRQGMISESEAKTSPHRNVITRAVGNREYVEVDTGSVDVVAGDRFVLCSDGLHGYLRDGEIELMAAGPGEDAVVHLVDMANGRGGRDNITVVLVDVLAGGEGAD